MELKEGDYFTFIRDNSTDSFDNIKGENGYFIARMGKNGEVSHYFYTYNKYFNKYVKFDRQDIPIEYRDITKQQKAHLDACIKANKYVECPLAEENVNLINDFIIF